MTKVIHAKLPRTDRGNDPNDHRDDADYLGGAAEIEDEASMVKPRKALAFTLDEIGRASLTPRCIVREYLYADVAGLISPGGVGKTTMLLREAVSIVLGRPLWGMAVDSPGWILFVTKEDPRERLGARLREIMRAMGLSIPEQQRVIENVIPLDVTGTPHKLTMVKDGNIVWQGLVDEITKTYRDDPPVMIIFDPLVSFGADEGMVNTNEQALIEVARCLVRELGSCVRYVHHSGKANAREGTTDQYTGRGGSALPDGCRMVSVLAAWNGSDPLPMGCASGDGIGIFRLERPKLSYSPPGLPTIWIRRDGFAYEHFIEIRVAPEAAAASRADQLVRFLAHGLKQAPKEYHTKTSLETLADSIGMTRAQVREAVEALRVRGRVMEMPLPKDRQQGSRKSFLYPAEIEIDLGGVVPE